MDEYQTEILINELQKLVVSKELTIKSQNYEIASLKKEIERLEHLLTPKAENDNI